MLVDEGKGQIFLSGITKDWVHYYLNIDGFQKTYRIKPDGTDRTLISQPNEVFYIIGMSGDWIYARKLIYKFSSYKSKTGGTYDNKKIKTGSKRMARAVSRDGWIYYIDSDDNLSLYRTSEDGSVNEKLHDGRITDIKISGSMLYFEILNSDSSENGIYSISLDKGNVKKICSDTGAFDVESNFIYYSPNSVDIFKNHISYSPNSTEIYKIGIDGGGREKIADKGSNNIKVIRAGCII